MLQAVGLVQNCSVPWLSYQTATSTPYPDGAKRIRYHCSVVQVSDHQGGTQCLRAHVPGTHPCQPVHERHFTSSANLVFLSYEPSVAIDHVPSEKSSSSGLAQEASKSDITSVINCPPCSNSCRHRASPHCPSVPASDKADVGDT